MPSQVRHHKNRQRLYPTTSESAGPEEVDTFGPSVQDQDEIQPLLSKKGTSRLWSPPIRKYVPIEIVAFGFMFSNSLCLPLIQFYLFDKVSQQYDGVNRTNSNPCRPGADNSSDANLEKEVQSKVSLYTTFLLLTISLPGIVNTLILGPISDRRGRRGCLLIPIVGLLAREIIYLIVFQLDLPLGYLFIGNVLDGLAGGIGTVLMTVFGMVADITPGGPKRTFRMAVVQAVLALSVALGMFVSGLWLGQAGYNQPLYFVTALTTMTLLFTIFVLPETRRNTPKDPISFKEHLVSIKRSFQMYTKDTVDKRRWKLIVSLFTFTTSSSVDLTMATILLLYLLATPFCWPKTGITTYTSVRTVINWTCILLVTRTCGRYISEMNIAIMACLSNCLFLLMVGLGYTDAMIYIAAALGVLSQGAPAMMRGVMSRLVSADEQGALFASVSSVEILAPSVLSVVMSIVYRASLSFFPGLIFIILAFFTLVTAALLGTLSYGIKKENARSAQTITVEPNVQSDNSQLWHKEGKCQIIADHHCGTERTVGRKIDN